MKNAKPKSRMAALAICASLLGGTLAARAANLPPDPNNAALLYYQAVALWSDLRSSYIDSDASPEPKDDSDTELTTGSPRLDKSESMMERLMRENLKADRESSRQAMRQLTIQFIEAASRMPQCTWGKKEWGLPALGSLRDIAFLLENDAYKLTASGDYRAALERCLTIRRFAGHLGDEGMLVHNVSQTVDGVAFRATRHVLGSMPPDAQTLIWLRSQLQTTPAARRSFLRALESDVQFSLQRLQAHPETVARIRNRFAEQGIAAKDKEGMEKFKGLSDEDIIPLIQEMASAVIAEFFDSARRVVESDKPYAQTSAEVELLTYKLREHDEIVPFYDLTTVMVTPEFHRLNVNHKTLINALNAAIDIYLVQAKTGHLPGVLPNGLPKDLFTGRDFGYDVTDEGFALRCQGEDFQRGRMRQTLEFKVRK